MTKVIHLFAILRTRQKTYGNFASKLSVLNIARALASQCNSTNGPHSSSSSNMPLSVQSGVACIPSDGSSLSETGKHVVKRGTFFDAFERLVYSSFPLIRHSYSIGGGKGVKRALKVTTENLSRKNQSPLQVRKRYVLIQTTA